MFWAATGLCLSLGLGLALLAFVTQSREATSERRAHLDAELRTLAASLHQHAELPFRPSRRYLQTLVNLARVRLALEWMQTGERDPDADRQSLLEGELADLMRAYAEERPVARAEAAMEDLRGAVHRAADHLKRLREGSGLADPAWAAEVAEAGAAVGVPPEVLEAFDARLKHVREATQALEDALGIALLDTQRLQQPGYEMVSFQPDPQRITLIGEGWAATGLGTDTQTPGRRVAFTVEGTALVHRLLNVGTWKSLARVEKGPHESVRYVVDTAAHHLETQGPEHARAVPAAARKLEAAWKALNPAAALPTFAKVQRKAFEDIFVELEPDIGAGTPDGKPDLDLWPTEGEIATVKDYFGPKDDLVLLRFTQENALRVQVLARAGLPYTNAGTAEEGQWAALPGATLLWVAPIRIPAGAEFRAFEAIQLIERPRAARRLGR
ncbi:MAG TPA: hypothetical protein VJ505_06435 [Holophagaceae bacterium]|nr:hypothetical protein [Holophagaceae bacterium]